MVLSSATVTDRGQSERGGQSDCANRPATSEVSSNAAAARVVLFEHMMTESKCSFTVERQVAIYVYL